jgi:hypothetical protein
MIRSVSASDMIGGVGHIVRMNESRFSKHKYEVSRLVKSSWIGRGIYKNMRVFFVETYFKEPENLRNIIKTYVPEAGLFMRIIGQVTAS